MRINQKRHHRKILKNRIALSTVVTTLIILVISVLLASVVTYFSINVTSTRVQEENLNLTRQHVWYDGANSASQAAIIIVNTGGRDVVIGKLTVRGQVVGWSHIFYVLTSKPLIQDMYYISGVGADDTPVTGDDSIKLVTASNELTLPSGQSMIIYLTNPDSISVNDIGLTVSITVYTSHAMYHKEANVQGTGSVQGEDAQPEEPPAEGEEVTLSGMRGWYNIETSKAQVAMVIQNTGGTNIVIKDIESCSAWGDVFFYTGTFTLESDLQYIPDLATGSATALEGATLTQMHAWPADLTIPSGQSMILYVKDATGVLNTDIGKSIQTSITTSTDNMYTASGDDIKAV